MNAPIWIYENRLYLPGQFTDYMYIERETVRMFVSQVIAWFESDLDMGKQKRCDNTFQNPETILGWESGQVYLCCLNPGGG